MIWPDERGSHALPDSSQTERPDRASPEIRMATQATAELHHAARMP